MLLISTTKLCRMQYLWVCKLGGTFDFSNCCYQY